MFCSVSVLFVHVWHDAPRQRGRKASTASEGPGDTTALCYHTLQPRFGRLPTCRRPEVGIMECSTKNQQTPAATPTTKLKTRQSLVYDAATRSCGQFYATEAGKRSYDLATSDGTAAGPARDIIF